MTFACPVTVRFLFKMLSFVGRLLMNFHCAEVDTDSVVLQVRIFESISSTRAYQVMSHLFPCCSKNRKDTYNTIEN